MADPGQPELPSLLGQILAGIGLVIRWVDRPWKAVLAIDLVFFAAMCLRNSGRKLIRIVELIVPIFRGDGYVPPEPQHLSLVAVFVFAVVSMGLVLLAGELERRSTTSGRPGGQA